MDNNDLVTMEKIVSLCKRRGFIFQGSEIYGGLANTWDYGPLGVELKNNIKNSWWKYFVSNRTDMLGLESSTLLSPKVWEASGHVSNFNDAMIDCLKCKSRLRADHLIEEALPEVKVEGLSLEKLDEIISENKIKCTKCGSIDFTKVRVFNLLFKTKIGPVDTDSSDIFLRGELAQSMFINFKNILNTSRKKIPFGIAQVGKVFRNEITPGNFIFRTLEFDLMEFEYFIHPDNWEKIFEYWLGEMQNWVKKTGIDIKKTRIREHSKEELSHYSKKTVDIEYETPIGWKELFGLAYRTDFDLRNHIEKSKTDLTYTDPTTNEKYIPHVVEPSFGLSRTLLMVLLSAYSEETVNGEKRVVMKFHKDMAPNKIAILPLVSKLNDTAVKILNELKDEYKSDYDYSGSIGKRYRRQDEIGTPYCITIDYDTVEKDNSVTIRDRDTMQQERIKIENIKSYLEENLKTE